MMMTTTTTMDLFQNILLTEGWTRAGWDRGRDVQMLWRMAAES